MYTEASRRRTHRPDGGEGLHEAPNRPPPVAVRAGVAVLRQGGQGEILEEIAELAKQCLEMCGDNRPSMKEVAEKLDGLRKVMQHPWVQQNPEEMESLLGEPSSIAGSTIVSGEYFSIEKKAVNSLQSGR